jgi:hypothetical protein
MSLGDQFSDSKGYRRARQLNACRSAIGPSPIDRISSISSNALCRSAFRTAFAARIASFATLLPSRFVKRFLGCGGSKLSVGEPEFS